MAMSSRPLLSVVLSASTVICFFCCAGCRQESPAAPKDSNLAGGGQGVQDRQPDALRLPGGFVSLFNGRDLAGWKKHAEFNQGRWTVEDGAIVGMQDPPGKGGFLCTVEHFRDFELLLETKIDWPFDSGVFLRMGKTVASHQVTLDHRPGGEIGGIYIPLPGRGYVRHCPDGSKYFSKNQWNHVRILCCGEPARICVRVNGVAVTDFQHSPETTEGIPARGSIALQVHPGGEGYANSKARFRSIYIREISPGQALFTSRNPN